MYLFWDLSSEQSLIPYINRSCLLPCRSIITSPLAATQTEYVGLTQGAPCSGSGTNSVLTTVQSHFSVSGHYSCIFSAVCNSDQTRPRSPLRCPERPAHPSRFHSLSTYANGKYGDSVTARGWRPSSEALLYKWVCPGYVTCGFWKMAPPRRRLGKRGCSQLM